jgi:hypothetical protein
MHGAPGERACSPSFYLAASFLMSPKSYAFQWERRSIYLVGRFFYMERRGFNNSAKSRGILMSAGRVWVRDRGSHILGDTCQVLIGRRAFSMWHVSSFDWSPSFFQSQLSMWDWHVAWHMPRVSLWLGLALARVIWKYYFERNLATTEARPHFPPHGNSATTPYR